ncbi:hypothetical protein C2E23DRAFT_539727 [Lenzites betulinus]|nr:hypothetical protein C2E23DRAFT_539727 [Lenzites betulinus]
MQSTSRCQPKLPETPTSQNPHRDRTRRKPGFPSQIPSPTMCAAYTRACSATICAQISRQVPRALGAVADGFPRARRTLGQNTAMCCVSIRQTGTPGHARRNTICISRLESVALTLLGGRNRRALHRSISSACRVSRQVWFASPGFNSRRVLLPPIFSPGFLRERARVCASQCGAPGPADAGGHSRTPPLQQAGPESDDGCTTGRRT